MNFWRGVLAAASATCGLGTAMLVARLGHPVLRDLMNGGGVVSWLCASFLSVCFLLAALGVLTSALLGCRPCWPGWMAGAVYMTTLAAAFSSRSPAYGGSGLVIGFSLYCTSIPFQLALLTRRLTRRPAVDAPVGPTVLERLLLPGAGRDRLDLPALRR